MGRHPSPADWAAYIDRDGAALDPPLRYRMRSHLEGCARCQSTLERVAAVRALLDLPVPEPDELSWRRLELRLDHRVRAPGEIHKTSMDLPPSFTWRDPSKEPTPSQTVDVIRGRRWLLAGLAAAAIVGAFLAIGPAVRDGSNPGPRGGPAVLAAEVNRSAVVRSGAAPLRLETRSGHRVELTSFTEVVVPEPDARPLRIELDHGGLTVSSLSPPPGLGRPPEALVIRTPELFAFAKSRDFAISYRAGRHRLEVWQGHVDVEGERVSERVSAGSTRFFVAPELQGGPAEPALPSIARLREGGPRSAVSRGQSEHRAETSTPGSPAATSTELRATVAPRRPASAREEAPAAGPAVGTEEVEGSEAASGAPASAGDSTRPDGAPPGGPRFRDAEGGAGSARPDPATRVDPETRVDRLGSTLTAAEQALAEARQAWFVDRDVLAAVELSERALALSTERDGHLAAGAANLLCDAQVSLRGGAEAVAACLRYLELERDIERRRRIHYRLGVVLRDQLEDCARAMDHFAKALVFGGRSRFDDVARLRRAECAIELGELDLARSDLEVLSERGTEAERVAKARGRLESLGREALGASHDAE